jgi:hypothetical protein
VNQKQNKKRTRNKGGNEKKKERMRDEKGDLHLFFVFYGAFSSQYYMCSCNRMTGEL